MVNIISIHEMAYHETYLGSSSSVMKHLQDVGHCSSGTCLV